MKLKSTRVFLVLTLIFLIGASIASGLQLSASTGGNGGSSSTKVSYEATLDDYAQQHVVLNPGDGTLSNAYSGSGSLGGASLSMYDSKGNYAYVYRSVSGAPGVTTWSYDWNTYKPYSSTTGYGAGAQLWLTASKAYSIRGNGYSSNAEGDSADASMTVGSSSSGTTSYLSNYYVNSYAYTNQVGVYQSASSASSAGPSTIAGTSNNKESDYTTTSITTTKGTISNPTTNVYSSKTSSYSYPTASLVNTAGTGILYGYASNSQRDSSKFTTTVSNGIISNPDFYAWSGTKFAETYGKVSNAYGTTAEISSQALNTVLGYQEAGSSRTKTLIARGEGDFAAKKINNYQFGSVSVTTRATNGNIDRTKNDITISTTGFGSNTALILDPRRWEFVTNAGGSEIRDSVMTSLKNNNLANNKGYAVTYYSDSAVSKDKVKQMDEYKVSVIHTHSSPTNLYLSKSTDGTNWDRMTAPELKSAYTNYNGMTLVVGCDSFKSTGPGTWADAISKANVRGGTTSEWTKVYGRTFINRYFASMASGNTASAANNYAAGSSGPKLLLLGNTGFKL
jgi:hypothetical protein